MNIPPSLIQSFITAEFPENKKTSTNQYCINSFYEANDTKRKLYVDANTGKFICFKSGEAGGFLKLVKDYLGISSNNQAIQYLIQNYNFDFQLTPEEVLKPVNTQAEREVLIKFLKEDRPVFFKDPDNLGMFGKKAYKYVRDRQLDECYYPKLGYVCNGKSRYDERIIIPFFENEKMVYFISRAINKNNPMRYLTPVGLDSKKYVFNIDKINEDFILAEGTMDAMSITEDQAASCLLSADIGVEQMNKIFAKKPNTLIYVPDNDKTGLAHMERNIKKLITYCPYSMDIYIFRVPDGCKDLNDMKIKTGKNYILKKECERYGTNLFAKSIW